MCPIIWLLGVGPQWEQVELVNPRARFASVNLTLSCWGRRTLRHTSQTKHMSVWTISCLTKRPPTTT